MSNSDSQLDVSVDTDNEEFDCNAGKIPREHLAAFQRLAKMNGKINRMKRQQLKATLESKQLSSEGEMDVMKKRLKNFYRRKALIKAKICDTDSNYFSYLVIIDIEATCTKDNPPDYQFEIIEFPAVLVDTKTRTIIDHFQAYVKPTFNSQLSEFCTELTGITQSQIDEADPFPVCLSRFTEWLEKHELGTKHTFTVVTDGSFDMGRFLYGQCIMSKIPYPEFATRWINIRKVFRSYYFTKHVKNTVPCNIDAMLQYFGMKFEGNPHSGLDDSQNISRICLQLLKDGALLDQNERIISLKKTTAFGKNDPLPVRPVHNLFCDGTHTKVQHWMNPLMKNISLKDGIKN